MEKLIEIYISIRRQIGIVENRILTENLPDTKISDLIKMSNHLELASKGVKDAAFYLHFEVSGELAERYTLVFVYNRY